MAQQLQPGNFLLASNRKILDSLYFQNLQESGNLSKLDSDYNRILHLPDNIQLYYNFVYWCLNQCSLHFQKEDNNQALQFVAGEVVERCTAAIPAVFPCSEKVALHQVLSYCQWQVLQQSLRDFDFDLKLKAVEITAEAEESWVYLEALVEYYIVDKD